MSLSTLIAARSSGSGCTEVKMEHLTYDWIIKEFKYLPQKCGECIYSPIFCTINNGLEWRLCFYPKRRNAFGNDSLALISLRLHSHKSETIKVEVHAEVSIPSAGWKSKFNWIYEEKQEKYGSSIEISKLNSIVSSVFTIRCELRIPLETITEPIDTAQSMERAFDSQGGQLNQDFRLFFKEPKFSDIAVMVGTEKFPAHKVVLATRSPVFAAMFEHKETQENLKNEVKIERMEPEVVKAMLEFIYTDEVTNLEELAYGLLEAADKYDLQRLRSMCEKILYKTINKDNAAEILIHADLHRSYKLKEYVLAFMDDHLSDVVETDSYKEILHVYPTLLKELISLIAIRRKSNK